MNETQPIYKKPLGQAVLWTLLFLLIYFVISGWKLPSILEFMFIGFSGVVWLGVFSQFLLPAKTDQDRLKIFSRLVAYIFGIKGPVKFIENGVTRKREGEEHRRGPGVIWLDSASASVLRNSFRFTKTHGPGVVFTSAGEHVAGTVDLHTQVHSRGPRDNDNPFAPKKENQPQAEYDEIQNRRSETTAKTRDGIEVVASISVVFKIDAVPLAGRFPFGYNQESVRKAITGEGINPLAPPGSEKKDVRWNELPISLAVELWREYLSRFRLDQLFETRTIGDLEETALQTIVRMMKERLKTGTVSRMDNYGNIVEGSYTSREKGWLEDHGIKVASVSIKRIFLSKEIEERLVQSWSANWLKSAQKEREQIERERSLRIRRGQLEATRQYAEMASAEISRNGEIAKRLEIYSREKPDKKAKTRVELMAYALELILHDMLRSVVRDSWLNRKLTTEQRELSDLIQWLRENA